MVLEHFGHGRSTAIRICLYRSAIPYRFIHFSKTELDGQQHFQTLSIHVQIKMSVVRVLIKIISAAQRGLNLDNDAWK